MTKHKKEEAPKQVTQSSKKPVTVDVGSIGGRITNGDLLSGESYRISKDEIQVTLNFRDTTSQ